MNDDPLTPTELDYARRQINQCLGRRSRSHTVWFATPQKIEFDTLTKEEVDRAAARTRVGGAK